MQTPRPAIRVQIKTVYGLDKVYPACPKALLFAGIARTKTLSNEVLADIQRLGFEVDVEQPTITINTGRI